jgi:hypothetical protein
VNEYPIGKQLAALANCEERLREVAAVLGMLDCEGEMADLVLVCERLAVVRAVRAARSEQEVA